MSTDQKNEDGDQHWNDIMTIVNRKNRPLNKSNTTDYEGSDMSHDDAIFDFISSEVDRTHVPVSATATNLERPVASLWYQRAFTSIYNNIKGSVPIRMSVAGTAGLALATLSVLVILPVVYLVMNNSEEAVTPVASNTAGFEMPSDVMAFANISQKYIDYSGGNLGIASGVQTERYKAFMTGVLHSDMKVIDSDVVDNAEELKSSLLQYHSINIIQEANDPADAKAAFEQAFASYRSSDTYGRWLYKGMVIELVYLTANVGLETKDYTSLIAMLDEYGNAIEIDTYLDQSDKYYKEHESLLSYVSKARNNELSDSDIREVRKHARNIKVRIQ